MMRKIEQKNCFTSFRREKSDTARNIPGNIFTVFMCRWRGWRVNNSGLYMFAIGSSETKCLQGLRNKQI